MGITEKNNVVEFVRIASKFGIAYLEHGKEHAETRKRWQQLTGLFNQMQIYMRDA